MWIGTYGGGLSRPRNGPIDASRPDLLGSDRMREMHAAAADGSIYGATAGGGPLRIDSENMTRYTTRNGLPTARIWTFEEDGAGGLWIATHGGGVVRWRNGAVHERITTREGLPNDFVRPAARCGRHVVDRHGSEIRRWDQAIVELRAFTDGIEASNTMRKHRLGRAILLIYRTLGMRLRGPLAWDTHMRPYYENMKRAYLKTQRFRRRTKTDEPAAEKSEPE